MRFLRRSRRRSRRQDCCVLLRCSCWEPFICAIHHKVSRPRYVGLGGRTRSLCKQWTVRIAAGFGLSPGHREAAMDRALVLGCRLLLHLPRACGTDTDSRILLVGRLSVSSGPVYAPAPVCSWSAPCHLERLMLICCSLPDDLGEVSRRRLCNPRHPGLSTWFTGLSAVAPAPTTLLCQQP